MRKSCIICHMFKFGTCLRCHVDKSSRVKQIIVENYGAAGETEVGFIARTQNQAFLMWIHQIRCGLGGEYQKQIDPFSSHLIFPLSLKSLNPLSSWSSPFSPLYLDLPPLILDSIPRLIRAPQGVEGVPHLQKTNLILFFIAKEHIFRN